jgi:hypothetical protein
MTQGDGSFCISLFTAWLPVSCLQFEFNYSLLEKPHIQNDTVTLHRKAAKDHQVGLASYWTIGLPWAQGGLGGEALGARGKWGGRGRVRGCKEF